MNSEVCPSAKELYHQSGRRTPFGNTWCCCCWCTSRWAACWVQLLGTIWIHVDKKMKRKKATSKVLGHYLEYGNNRSLKMILFCWLIPKSESIGAMCWLTGEHLKGLLCGGAPALLLLLLLLRKFCPIGSCLAPAVNTPFWPSAAWRVGTDENCCYFKVR